MVDTRDRILNDYEHWIPYFSSFCSAFFISSLRTSTMFIFDNCKVPFFPCPLKTGSRIPFHYVEYIHGKDNKKDIPVFFNGRAIVRVARRFFGNLIIKSIPGSYIKFLDDGIALSGHEYVDMMSKSKISWCPRSIWSDPNRDCNTTIGKEIEAMCLESMVLKQPLGVIETEERIPGIHFVEYKNDSSDLIEKIEYYLEHEEKRKEIARNGRLWWERNCSPISRSVYMFNKAISTFL